MPEQRSIERYEASDGAAIFRLPQEVFPGLIGYAHLIIRDGVSTLVDVGSGFGTSHRDLLAGFEQVNEQFGVSVGMGTLNNIVITHGHVDHFGGLTQVLELAPQAKVAIHELDRLVLIKYDERVMVSSKGMRDFLRRAGVPDDRLKRLMDMFMMGKQSFKSAPVDVTLHDGDEFEGMRVIHVPGHTPGLIMLMVGDILLTSDHILPGTSVALAPESLMPYTGVGHYLDSLIKAGQVEGVRLALGGHDWVMENYYEVAQKTHVSSVEKVENVLAECAEPSSIYELAVRIYGEMDGYGELLKLEQTGARIEYLNQRGLVMIDNLDALEQEDCPVLRYRRV